MKKKIKIKTFKGFVNDKLKDENLDGIIDELIHFKHGNYKDKDKDGIIDEPIHFKHGNYNRKIHEEYDTWLKTDENGDDPHEISKSLHKDQKLDREHIGAIRDYTDSESEFLNRSLIRNRGSVSKLSNHHKIYAERLDDAVKKNPINRNLTVYSGLTFDPRKKIGKNGVMKSHAYISTTHHKETAHNFARAVHVDADGNEHRHIMHLDLKEGDHALHVAQHSWHPGEHETILGRGTRLQYHKTEVHKGKGIIVHVHHMSIAK